MDRLDAVRPKILYRIGKDYKNQMVWWDIFFTSFYYCANLNGIEENIELKFMFVIMKLFLNIFLIYLFG